MTDAIRAIPSQPPAPGRMPPQSLEAEMAVLGAVLLDNNAFSIATESITHERVLQEERTQDIFAAMEGLAARGEAIDVVTLSEELKQRGTYPVRRRRHATSPRSWTASTRRRTSSTTRTSCSRSS